MIRPPRTRARHVAAALLIATACTIVFATRVFTSFTGVRVRAAGISAAPVDGIVRVYTEGDRWRELVPPFAVIARIRNGSPVPQRFSISVDGEPVCDADVPAGKTRRIDCASAEGAVLERHDVVVRSGNEPSTPLGPGWTLEHAELATHHGRSSGLITAFVLPAGVDRSTHPAIGWTVLVWLLLTIAFAVPLPRSHTSSSAEVLGSRALMAFVAIVFAAAYFSPALTPYRIVFSTGTFAGWMMLVMAARVYVFLGPDGRSDLAAATAAGGRQMWARLVAKHEFLAPRVGLLRAAGVGFLITWIFFSFASAVAARWHHDNFSGLVHISQRFFDGNPLARDRADVRNTIAFAEGNGYDGQWFYHMAYDPFLSAFRNQPQQYRSFIDAPPYRYGRIGFSLLTKAFSGNRPEWYPIAMVTLVIGALGVGGALLGVIAREHGASVWHGALILLVAGYWCSVDLAVPEPIAAAFFLGGYLCLLRKTWWAAGLLFGFSLLVRETGGVFILALVVATFLSRQRREATIVGLMAFAPLVAWRLYVGWVFVREFGLEAFTHHPDNFDPPLKGIWELWTLIANGAYTAGGSDMIRAGMTFPFLVMGAVVLIVIAALRRPGPIATAGLVYAAMAICFNYRNVWLDISNAQRLTVDLFLSLALVSASTPRGDSSRFSAALTGLWVGAAAYMLFGTFNVLVTRRAIFPWL